MKKSRKLIMLIITILVIIGLLNVNKVYADPNSSKGFAEFDDEQAEQESQKMLEEQQKELKEAEGKSTNNYLDSLTVEGYELSPKFDKQTIEYKINGNVNDSEINIVATPSDSKAKVEGAGKVKVNGNEFRIDVIAESGTVRTYKIYLSDQINNTEQNNQEEKQEEPKNVEENQEEETIEETSSTVQESGKLENNNVENTETSFNNLSIIWIVILVILAIIIAAVLIRKNRKSKGKHC